MLHAQVLVSFDVVILLIVNILHDFRYQNATTQCGIVSCKPLQPREGEPR